MTTIPYLTPDQICQGTYTDGDKGCIMEWLDRTFPAPIRDALKHPHRDLMLMEIRETIGEDGVMIWNDRESTTPEMIADTWNLAAQRLSKRMEVVRG
jgi:hypothetical protein